MNRFPKHDIDAGMIIKMIDESRKSRARAVIDINFSTVQKSGKISELLAYLTAVKLRRE